MSRSLPSGEGREVHSVSQAQKLRGGQTPGSLGTANELRVALESGFQGTMTREEAGGLQGLILPRLGLGA